MNIKIRTIMGAVVAIAGMGLLCSAESNLDVDQIRKDPFTAFITHVVWPDDKYIQAHKSAQLPQSFDITDLEGVLQRAVRSDYRPAKSDLKNVIALTNYLSEVKDLTDMIRGNDYLLLRYNSTNGTSIAIQDGMTLNLLMMNPPSLYKFTEDVTNYVGSIAVDVLNYPKGTDLGQLNVFVSSMNLSGSRLGFVYFGKKHCEVDEWYGQVAWWADGNRILFCLSKLTHEEMTQMKNYSNPKAFLKSRRLRPLIESNRESGK